MSENDVRNFPLVSVIVTTYNLAAYIGEAVESALAQMYRPIEVVVVDDGSKDNTREILQPYLGQIDYVYQENQGGAVARNVAIAASHGDFIAILDADDVWLPTKLTEQVAFMMSHPDIGLVASHVMPIDERGALLSQEPTRAGWHAENVPVDQILLHSPLINSTHLVRRECLPSPPYTPGRYHADWEFCLRVAANHRVGFLDKILAYCRVVSTSMTAPLVSQDRVETKYRDRMEILNSVTPLIRSNSADIESLRKKVEAREGVSYAIASYGNGAFESAKRILGRAVELEPSHWYSGGELADRICNHAKLLYHSDGAARCLGYLHDVVKHLPDNLPHQNRLRSTVNGRIYVFVLGFDAYSMGDLRSARANIIKGIRHDRSLLRNRGVLSTLAKCFLSSSASQPSRIANG